MSDTYLEALREAVERHTAHGWSGLSQKPEGRSHIVSGLNPVNGAYFEQRVAGTATEASAYAISQGLVGEKFKVSKDIYDA